MTMNHVILLGKADQEVVYLDILKVVYIIKYCKIAPFVLIIVWNV